MLKYAYTRICMLVYVCALILSIDLFLSAQLTDFNPANTTTEASLTYLETPMPKQLEANRSYTSCTRGMRALCGSNQSSSTSGELYFSAANVITTACSERRRPV